MKRVCSHCGKKWPCDMAGLYPHWMRRVNEDARYEETDTDRWSEDVLEARWGADVQPWEEPSRD